MSRPRHRDAHSGAAGCATIADMLSRGLVVTPCWWRSRPRPRSRRGSGHSSTVSKWDGLLHESALAPLRARDFEVVDAGDTPIGVTNTCQRNPL